MRINRPLVMLGTLLGASAFNAHATLTSYSVYGADLVYSSISDVTWTQDANLLGTLETTLGYTNAIEAIISASPSITDTANYWDTPSYSGQHTVTASDFLTGGLANWFGAQAFVGYLNSINYGGSTKWRLPTSNDNFANNGTVGNELAQLFYSELSGTVFSPIPNTSTFNNEQAYAYWSTEYMNPHNARFFDTSSGMQSYAIKDSQLYSWAVTSGQIVATPIPAATWLFGPVLLALLGFNKRAGGSQA